MAHLPSSNAWIVIRGTDSVAAAVRQAVQAVDSELAITEVATMTGILQDSLGGSGWPRCWLDSLPSLLP